jgi:hypothetical protein
MFYTVLVTPSTRAGNVTATSSDGYRCTTSTPLLDGARYWKSLGAPSSASIVTIWSSGPGHWAPRSLSATPPSSARRGFKPPGDANFRAAQGTVAAPPMRCF